MTISYRYDYYSFSIIPSVGELVAGDRESYQYLVESIRRFPRQVLILPHNTTYWNIDYNLLEDSKSDNGDNILVAQV